MQYMYILFCINKIILIIFALYYFTNIHIKKNSFLLDLWQNAQWKWCVMISSRTALPRVFSWVEFDLQYKIYVAFISITVPFSLSTVMKLP